MDNEASQVMNTSCKVAQERLVAVIAIVVDNELFLWRPSGPSGPLSRWSQPHHACAEEKKDNRPTEIGLLRRWNLLVGHRKGPGHCISCQCLDLFFYPTSFMAFQDQNSDTPLERSNRCKGRFAASPSPHHLRPVPFRNDPTTHRFLPSWVHSDRWQDGRPRPKSFGLTAHVMCGAFHVMRGARGPLNLDELGRLQGDLGKTPALAARRVRAGLARYSASVPLPGPIGVKVHVVFSC